MFPEKNVKLTSLVKKNGCVVKMPGKEKTTIMVKVTHHQNGWYKAFRTVFFHKKSLDPTFTGHCAMPEQGAWHIAIDTPPR